jgi:hypothetical protein
MGADGSNRKGGNMADIENPPQRSSTAVLGILTLVALGILLLLGWIFGFPFG